MFYMYTCMYIYTYIAANVIENKIQEHTVQLLRTREVLHIYECNRVYIYTDMQTCVDINKYMYT